jgi:hypothetical protein
VFEVQPCNDHLGCTDDYCDQTFGGTGTCNYDAIPCPTSNNNCTLNFCMYGNCDSRSLCPENLMVESLTAGHISLIVVAIVIGLAGLAGSGYVIFKIRRAPKKEKHGGKIENYAVD